MFHKWQITIKNHGAFVFEGCNNFEMADFFLRSADGDFLRSDSFEAGTCSALTAADCTSFSSCLVQLAWTASLAPLLPTPLWTGVVVASFSSALHTQCTLTTILNTTEFYFCRESRQNQTLLLTSASKYSHCHCHCWFLWQCNNL